MVHLNLVEIYLAANAIEAYTVANALEGAGIKAHVEGELSGGLPIGQTITPSVCVWKEEEARAREILEQWQTETKNTPEAEEPESETEQPPLEESAETEKEIPLPTLPGRDLSFLSFVLGLAAIAFIGMGIFYAIANQQLRNRYTEPVLAKLIKVANNSRIYFGGEQKESPIFNWRDWTVFTSWKGWYVYQVEGLSRIIVIERKNFPADNITIYYDPENPGDYHVGGILHPGWCLAFSGIFAAFALFLAYQFR